MKLKKGDQVIVISGRDRGQTGSVIKLLPRLNQVVVDGINLVKRSHKPSSQNPRGGIKTEPRGLPVAKVAIVHPKHSNRPSRIGYTFTKDGTKLRVYRQANNQPIKETK